MTIRLIGMLTLLTLAGTIAVAQAQPIVPAQDGTGTIVTPLPPGSPSDPTVYDITGGSLSGDQLNLFHSFQQFGLNPNQIANFVANPQLQNILGRITGGDPSVINGIIQVTGGSPNLYLLNPAGIIFGDNASLNIPASFTATTATGIGFGSGTWDLGNPAPNYGALMGNPTSFLFNTAQPGSLVNAGNLTVMNGRALNLVGGIVVNTGTLTAPGGTITVLSVPGSSLVRLSSPGSLLSLEIDPAGVGTFPLPSPATLPQLLTGSGLSSQATGLAVNSDGTVRLTATNTVIPQQAGMTIVSGTVNASGAVHLGYPVRIHILGDRVGLFSATVNASGSGSAGTVLIGGDYQGRGTVPNAQVTVVDATSKIQADAATLVSDRWSIGGANYLGTGGKVIIWSDNITRFQGRISAYGIYSNYLFPPISSTYPPLSALGFVEISGKRTVDYQGSVSLLAPNRSLPTTQPMGTLLLDADNIEIFDGAGNSNPVTMLDALEPNDAPNILRIPARSLESSVFADILLKAGNTITIQDLSSNTFSLGTSFPAPSSSVSPGSVTFQADGNFTMNPGDTIAANQRNFSISARSITTGNIDTSDRPAYTTQSRNAGFITLTARDDVSTGKLTSDSQSRSSAGAITIRSATGSVHTGSLNSSFSPSMYATVPNPVNIIASGGITTGNITTISTSSQSNVNLSSTNGNISTGSILIRGGGIITLAAHDQWDITGNVTASSVNVTIFSATGTINLGAAPNPVTISAGKINFGNATLFGNSDLTLDAGQGTITLGRVGSATQPLGSLTATANSAILGGNIYTAGNLSLTSDIQLPQPTVLASGNNVAITGNVTGSSLTIAAVNSITTGGITTSSQTGNAGAVTLSADDIQVRSINTQAGSNGMGGAVNITASRNLRVTDSLLDQAGVTASIATSGGLSGGAVTLRHGGGDTTPFIVGDATVNGVAATIATGTSTLAPPFSVPPGTFTQGNITIVTPTSPPTQPPPTEPPISPPTEPPISPPPTNPPSLPPSMQLTPSPNLLPPTEIDTSTLYRFQQEFVLPAMDSWSVELLDNQPVLVIDRDQPSK